MKYQINTQSQEELDIYVAAIEKFGIKNQTDSSISYYDYPSLLITLDEPFNLINNTIIRCISIYYINWPCKLISFSDFIKLLTNKRTIKVKLNENVNLEYSMEQVNIGSLKFSPEPFIEFGKQLEKIMH